MNFHFDTAKNRRKIVVIALALFVTAALSYVAFGQFSGPAEHTHENHAKSDIEYWTCPMHPQIHEDGPGQCPICHMDLVPVRKHKTGTSNAVMQEPVTGDHEGHKHSSSAMDSMVKPVQISLDRQQMIGIRFVSVEEKELHTTIETTGRVAYDPELAVAIKEYLAILASGDQALLRQSVTRLRTLGMGDEEIHQLPHRRREYESLNLRGSGSVWIYATLYQNDLPFVKPGMRAKIRLPAGGSGQSWDGIVRSLSPTVDPMTRSLQARVEVRHGKDLRPDMYVNVALLSRAGRGLVVPLDALVDTGNRQLVYVKSGKDSFSPREVRVGGETDEGIHILSGVRAGEEVVAAATFLVDSESRLRGGM